MRYLEGTLLVLWVVYLVLFVTATALGIEVRGPIEFARDVIGEIGEMR